LSELPVGVIRADLIEFHISRFERDQENNFARRASRYSMSPRAFNAVEPASRNRAAENHRIPKGAFVTRILT
jgi:hypothetical protein